MVHSTLSDAAALVDACQILEVRASASRLCQEDAAGFFTAFPMSRLIR